MDIVSKEAHIMTIRSIFDTAIQKSFPYLPKNIRDIFAEGIIQIIAM